MTLSQTPRLPARFGLAGAAMIVGIVGCVAFVLAIVWSTSRQDDGVTPIFLPTFSVGLLFAIPTLILGYVSRKPVKSYPSTTGVVLGWLLVGGSVFVGIGAQGGSGSNVGEATGATSCRDANVELTWLHFFPSNNTVLVRMHNRGTHELSNYFGNMWAFSGREEFHFETTTRQNLSPGDRADLPYSATVRVSATELTAFSLSYYVLGGHSVKLQCTLSPPIGTGIP